ncbi:TetR/AcrR family transcriptional regulator [Rhodococcus sp. ACPA4]|uniref:TetR family transcriptional regulator n=1 Tax=Nocardia globerula TaxID=1818 RepID=A0A652YU89_NOCGL|nr:MULTISPECIES: ScbR family autoregulator-binding transcription factor [Rhodococcus]NMD60823.1 TetR/AcrR family transcriptional regulator [Nocardia globerula]KJF20945.1 A-factor-binding protein [Rhodococcus sp. AD45]MCE4264617.1 TetR/AcrR family transcriptional regulator [Rhodococcus globerulus]MDV8066948.1 ScbR family autoregulator-binding transcription factor [Rhodococcus sp. IEGM 1366]PBC37423.1 TetR/AcrR family transcriptional regulator [Rhodococcus sp. ACPA4]
MQERAKISRQQILRGAADRFEISGYGSTSMNDIVSASRMTKGAVYFHFSSKDELAQAVIDEQHRISLASFSAAASTGAPALEQVIMVCNEIARQLISDPVVRAGIRLTLELNTADGPFEPYLTWIRELQRLADIAQQEGDIRQDVTPESVGRVVTATFTGVQMVSNVLTRRADLSERIDELFVLLLAGVVSEKRRGDIDTLVRTRLESYVA